MWERIGRRHAKRSGGAAAPLSGALGRVGGPFGRQETKKHVRTTHERSVGLGLLGALALVATVSVVLVLRRRAARRSSPVEESNEEAAGAVESNERMKAEGSIEQEGDTTEGHKEYYRRVIRESMERSGLS
jgi:nitrate/nitrite transporter NarK